MRENGLKKAYDAGTFDAATRTYTPSPVRVLIRRLMQLAFHPVDLVASSFEQILELIPSNLYLDDFLAYFQTTWIQGVTTARISKPSRFPPPGPPPPRRPPPRRLHDMESESMFRLDVLGSQIRSA